MTALGLATLLGDTFFTDANARPAEGEDSRSLAVAILAGFLGCSGPTLSI
jgi:hypothetical protein